MTYPAVTVIVLPVIVLAAALPGVARFIRRPDGCLAQRVGTFLL